MLSRVLSQKLGDLCCFNVVISYLCGLGGALDLSLATKDHITILLYYRLCMKLTDANEAIK